MRWSVLCKWLFLSTVTDETEMEYLHGRCLYLLRWIPPLKPKLNATMCNLNPLFFVLLTTPFPQPNSPFLLIAALEAFKDPFSVTLQCSLWLKTYILPFLLAGLFFPDFQICIIRDLLCRLTFLSQSILGCNKLCRLPAELHLPWYSRWSCHCTYLVATAGFGAPKQIP